MIEPETVAAVVNDSRLSPEARTVVLYVLCRGDGPQEIPHREFARILQNPGEKRLRRAIQDAVDLWLSRSIGGRGHSDTYEVRVAASADLTDRSASKSADLNDRVAAGDNLNALRSAATAHLSAPPTPTTDTPTPTPTTARVNGRPADTDLARLRTYLGEHSRAVDMMLESGDHGTTWAAAVLGKYGASGTQVPADIPPPRWPAVLANALIDFSSQKKPYSNRHFDGYYNTAANDERNPKRTAKNRPGDSGAPAEGGGAPKASKFAGRVEVASAGDPARKAV